MNPQQIQANNWIFVSAIFGEKAYKVESVRNISSNGAEVKLTYGAVTFSVMLGENNWYFAVQSDLG